MTAVAIAGGLVASGAATAYCAWRIPPGADVDDPAHPRDGETLRAVGFARHPDVVTGAEFDVAGGCVWTSCLDGKIRRWGLRDAKDDAKDDEDDDEEDTRLELLGEWSTGQAALCLSLDPDARVLYAGTADGGAVALDAGSLDTAVDTADTAVSSLTIGATLGAWTAHEDGVTRSVSHARGGCLTGSSTGAVYAWRVDRREGASCVSPSLAAKMTGHAAAVVSISTGIRGTWCRGRTTGRCACGTRPISRPTTRTERSAAAAATEETECLYAVTGHTVWLGSVQADETRIVCDGANNIAMCYDFSDDPDDNGDI